MDPGNGSPVGGDASEDASEDYSTEPEQPVPEGREPDDPDTGWVPM